MLDARTRELKEFMAKLTPKVPRPARIEVANALLGARKVVSLVFICPATKFELTVEVTSWSLWLKFAVSLVRVGVVFVFCEISAAAENSLDVVKNAYEMYSKGDVTAASFEAHMRAPLLLSSEQDQIIRGLREKKFFDRFKYDAQQGEWIHGQSSTRITASPSETSLGGGGGGEEEEALPA